MKRVNEMTEYVQYHNPAKNAPLQHQVGYFGIYTRKSIGSVNNGDRVWVITSSGPPRQYYLVEWFTVDDTEENMPHEDNIVSGRSGTFFRPPVRVDEKPWFRNFLRNQGNFGRGFSPITHNVFIRGLEAAAGLNLLAKTRENTGT